MEKFLVTSALPYANGPLHFGHLAGVYLPADIFCRHKRMMGQEVVHICGSDEHGVAIMLSAEKEGLDYQEYVNKWHQEHHDLFHHYGIVFDFFGQTSSSYHREEVLQWFDILYKKGLIEKRPEKQLFCNSCPRFLPDRYVEGTCYVCGHQGARGDECPHCGEWIDSILLKDPSCKICHSKDITIQNSEHWYLLLTQVEETFRPWFSSRQHWRSHVWGYVNGLIQKGLVDRAITRDLAWGIDVPLAEAKGKKLYVWFDAPIGYVSYTKEWIRSTGRKENYLKDWWNHPETQIIHFIGKDNVIFHGLIWPSMVLGSGLVQPPTDVPASHFVNLEGQQFSKSSGWYVDSKKAIDTFGEDALRFYLCSIIPETGDTNFSWDHFLQMNNELGNKIGNFINRAMSFLAKSWPTGLPPESFQQAFKTPEYSRIQELVRDIREPLDKIQHQKALTGLLRLGEVANETFHQHAPWQSLKTNRNQAEISMALSVVFTLVINSVFRPFLPKFSTTLAEYFKPLVTEDLLNQIYRGEFSKLEEFFKTGYQLPLTPSPLLPRIDPKMIEPFRLKSSPESSR
jgi:methionyl-tRNA synthetase